MKVKSAGNFLRVRTGMIGNQKCEELLGSVFHLVPLLHSLLIWPEKAGIVPKAIKKCDWKNENPELCPQNVFPSHLNVSVLPNSISPSLLFFSLTFISMPK